MGLEALVEIQDFLMNNSLTAVLDIGGHLLTGAFLTHRYFPEAEKSKKAVLTFCSGLLPDFDYFTFGLIPHKTTTHTIAFGAWMTTNVYNANSEDRENESLLPTLKERIKSIATSRWAKLTGYGIGAHLSLDFIFRESTELTVLYTCAAATALTTQMIYNHKKDRYKKVEKPYKIQECIVENSTGQRFWVNQYTQAHELMNKNTNLPVCNIPDYVYGTNQGRELVRAYQKKNIPRKPSIWKRIDDFFLKAYVGMQTKLMGSK